MTLQLFKNVTALPSKPDVQQAIAESLECQKLLQQSYKYEAAHEYADKNGTPLFYRVRLKHQDTKDKWIRPVHFNGTGWVWKEPEFEGGKKPLYNLQAITSNPQATIWICEGEWAADVLNKLFHKLKMQELNIATTSGACGSADKVDWSILTNRKVIIWPDNDTVGLKYAENVASKLSELSCYVEMVNVEKLDLPESGDAVDWLKANPNAGLDKFESIEKTPPVFEYPVEPLFPLAEAKVGKFLKEPPPPQKWILQQCLPLGKTVLLLGQGGVGKSKLTMQLQISLALDVPFCGHWAIGESGATLGLYSEDEESELHRRFQRITEGLSPKHKKLIEERVLMRSMVGMSNQLTYKDGSEVSLTDYVDRLIALAKQIQNLKLIIIDPASRFRGGDENNSTDTTRFVEACEVIAQATSTTVMILHHVNKGSMTASESSQSASRGSSALVDGVRWVMNLSPMSKDEAKAFGILDKLRRFYVRTTVTKNNYAPPQDGDVWLKLSETGVLEHVELTTTADTKNEGKIAKIVQKVADNAANGIEHSKSGFAKEYSGAEGIFEIGDQGLRGLIEQAIEKGLLVLKAPKIQKKNVLEVLVVADKIKESEFHGLTVDFDNNL